MKDNILENVLDERKKFISFKNECNENSMQCDKHSVAGSVSQRACVYGGARVVLNPITDAIHIVHGPVGCASYTWDIRGSLTSGSDTFRNTFSTDFKEQDIIFGGEKKLEGAIDEIVKKYSPKLIFVYATCVAGIIGDDIEAVCKKMEAKYSIRIIALQSSGFTGTKSLGYKLAGEALMKVFEGADTEKIRGVNILGEFNVAGEIWIIKRYLEQLGIPVISKITGDSTYEELRRAPKAMLNIVQCAQTTTYLAKEMKEKYNIPFAKVRFLGIDDTKESLMTIAELLGDKNTIEKAKQLIEMEEAKVRPTLDYYKKRLQGKKAAIQVGGAYKVISLINQFKEIGMKVVEFGSQTGNAEDYKLLEGMCDKGTIIVNDSNPAELHKFIKESGADILVGGIKERMLAYKLGIAFCDYNHERKQPFSGYEGTVNFAKEVYTTITSPVWKSAKSEIIQEVEELTVNGVAL